METSSTVTSVVGNARAKLLFGYDFQGRRTSKVVSNWTGSAWTLSKDLKYIYDGWNLVGELDTTDILIRSYTLGLDLSRTEQGASGVIVLLFENRSPIFNILNVGQMFHRSLVNLGPSY